MILFIADKRGCTKSKFGAATFAFVEFIKARCRNLMKKGVL